MLLAAKLFDWLWVDKVIPDISVLSIIKNSTPFTTVWIVFPEGVIELRYSTMPSFLTIIVLFNFTLNKYWPLGYLLTSRWVL